MAHIPQSVLDKQPLLQGLKLRGRGKVRDSYDLLPELPNNMLVVASDRCSIFDFVLPTLVPLKGEILTALNYFWITEVLGTVCENDFVACGAAIDRWVPLNYIDNVDLQKRATIVRIVPAPDAEDIVRLILTGSGWTSYQSTQSICGHNLPPGLTNGGLLPYPIYTPTTKAEIGHDEHVTADSVVAKYGYKRERLALQAAGAIANFAAKRGIIMADTKFEFSLNGETLVLADEKGTPDSSRFVDEAAWKKAVAKGQFPPSLDKQYVREWGIKIGINKRNPEVPDDVAFVDSLEVPSAVVEMTTRIYRYIFWRLTGMQIEVFQRRKMKIDTHATRRKIVILLGSESDLPQTKEGLLFLQYTADFRVHVMSCHRNPDELRRFAENRQDGADLIIAGAGKSAQLPAVLKSWLCHFNRSEIPVIGVAFEGESESANRAAIDAIEELPGQPVELDPQGHAYFGTKGFHDACVAAVEHEFLPKAFESKPTKFDICSNR